MHKLSWVKNPTSYASEEVGVFSNESGVKSKIEPQLHTSMCFFLSHLSFCDLCYSSAIVPKMLLNFLREKKAISFAGCEAQSYVFA